MNNQEIERGVNNFPELGTYEYSKSILFNDVKNPKKRANCLLREYQKDLAGKCFFCKSTEMTLSKNLDWSERPVVCFNCLTKIKAFYNFQPNHFIFTKYE